MSQNWLRETFFFKIQLMNTEKGKREFRTPMKFNSMKLKMITTRFCQSLKVLMLPMKNSLIMPRLVFKMLIMDNLLVLKNRRIAKIRNILRTWDQWPKVIWMSSRITVRNMTSISETMDKSSLISKIKLLSERKRLLKFMQRRSCNTK